MCVHHRWILVVQLFRDRSPRRFTPSQECWDNIARTLTTIIHVRKLLGIVSKECVSIILMFASNTSQKASKHHNMKPERQLCLLMFNLFNYIENYSSLPKTLVLLEVFVYQLGYQKSSTKMYKSVNPHSAWWNHVCHHHFGLTWELPTPGIPQHHVALAATAPNTLARAIAWTRKSEVSKVGKPKYGNPSLI